MQKNSRFTLYRDQAEVMLQATKATYPLKATPHCWLGGQLNWETYFHMYCMSPNAFLIEHRLRILHKVLDRYARKIRAQSSRIQPNTLLAFSATNQVKKIVNRQDCQVIYETALSLLQESPEFAQECMVPERHFTNQSLHYVDFEYHTLLRFKGLAYWLNEGLLAGKPTGHYQDLFASEPSMFHLGKIQVNFVGHINLYEYRWHAPLLLVLALTGAIDGHSIQGVRANVARMIYIAKRHGVF